MRKGEIACNKQFLLFAQCFPPYMTLIFHFKCHLQFVLTLSQASPGFYASAVQGLENVVGKGEIAHNKHFLLFPQCFLPIQGSYRHFHQILNCHLQAISVWKSLKFVVWERVNLDQSNLDLLTLSQTSPGFYVSTVQVF